MSPCCERPAPEPAAPLPINAWGDAIYPPAPAPRPIPWGKALVLLAVAAGWAVPLFAGDRAAVRSFALVFGSILLEALPFMLVGSLIGGLIEVFVSRERLTRHLPRGPLALTCVAASLGLLLPVCECAVVPVVRRLTRKGFPLSAAVAYLLGAPIVNPILGASTFLAYAGDWRIVVARLGAGYAIAVGVGWLMGRLFANRPARLAAAADSAHAGCGCRHDHGHGHAPVSARRVAALRHASDDFTAVAHYLVIGAAIAALAQTVVERRAVLEFAAVPFLPAAAMMALAILLNLCSEADAFIAASFRGLVPTHAQLAFLLTGPMFDLKLLLMYRTLFTRRAIGVLSVLILLAVALAVAALGLAGKAGA
ncbi:MAG: permease [Opitutae bacterium]|nr:permease [Opitutae bacterium]